MHQSAPALGMLPGHSQREFFGLFAICEPVNDSYLPNRPEPGEDPRAGRGAPSFAESGGTRASGGSANPDRTQPRPNRCVWSESDSARLVRAPTTRPGGNLTVSDLQSPEGPGRASGRAVPRRAAERRLPAPDSSRVGRGQRASRLVPGGEADRRAARPRRRRWW